MKQKNSSRFPLPFSSWCFFVSLKMVFEICPFWKQRTGKKNRHCGQKFTKAEKEETTTYFCFQTADPVGPIWWQNIFWKCFKVIQSCKVGQNGSYLSGQRLFVCFHVCVVYILSFRWIFFIFLLYWFYMVASQKSEFCSWESVSFFFQCLLAHSLQNMSETVNFIACLFLNCPFFAPLFLFHSS